MDALDLLRQQATMADDLMARVTAELTADQAAWRLDGSAANPIAATFLHVYLTEDRVVQQAQGRPPLFESGGWQGRLGVEAPLGVEPAAVWAATARPDPAALRAYAGEVRAASRAYLDGLEPAALEQEIDTSRGKRPRVAALSLALVAHKFTHVGDISALLGCQGLKGFPV